jgi:3-dehydroquinate dehydratase-2
VSAVASAVIVGAGTNGYLLALAHVEHLLSATATSSRPSDAGLEQAAAPVSALVLDASPASSGIPASGPPEEAAADVRRRVSEVGARLGIRVEFFHGDDEQDLVAAIRGSARHDAIVIDAARLAVTSNAVREAVAALSIPVIELRESHPPADGRAASPSLLSAVATTVITGAGDDAHSLALQQVAHLASARG